jgi:hypothetical protein
MKAALATLYILTALVTGLDNLYWLMGMVNGAPLNILNLIALLGAATLVGATVAVPFRPPVAVKIGFAGSLLLCVYYAPLIAVSIFTPFSTWHSIRFFISFRDYVPVMGILVGPILVIASTTNSAIFFRAKSW